MNDNENIILKGRKASNWGNQEAALDHKLDAPLSVMVGLPEEQTHETSDNFESLTYVSSQGFFFQ